MKFHSTRGAVSGLSFEDVILKGYAPDGGMYLPMEVPVLSAETLKSWSTLSYIEIVKEVSALFIEDEIPRDEVNAIIEKSFQSFTDPSEPIKTVKLTPDITLLEMFHGRSLAFKDLSMSCTAQFIQYFLQKKQSHLIMLIATSGDTGSSALEAVSSLSNVDIVVLLPKDRISKVQELQMTTVIADNCYVIRADGTSDDTDVPIKRLFCDEEFTESHNLGSLNSVNWCRMMVQIAHHFYAYFQGKVAGDQEKTTTDFLPTGGLGNAASACIAYKMGLPIKVVCAVTNDALQKAVDDGIYAVSDLYISLAPAINIQVPYNFERILCLLSDMDTDMVKKIMTEYETDGKTVLPSDVLEKVREFMEVKLVKNDDILNAIRRCHNDNNYVVCPHTATALAVAYDYPLKDTSNIVVLGVASPMKFGNIVDKAGIEWEGRDLLSELSNKPAKYRDWLVTDDWYEKLRLLVLEINSKQG